MKEEITTIIMVCLLLLINNNNYIIDINECEFDDSYDCPLSAICINTNGSYDCICINNTLKDESGNCTGIIMIIIRFYHYTSFNMSLEFRPVYFTVYLWVD